MEKDDLLRRLERVEASLAIQQLAVRYGQSVDMRDFDALSELYADDADFGSSGIGREAVKAYFGPRTSPFYRSIHQIVGHSYDFIDDENATGRVYCKAEHEAGDKWIVTQMCYFDKYVKRDGKWYFSGPRDHDFFYSCDIKDHPQDVGFQRWVIEGMKIPEPLMHHRFPSWKPYWDALGADHVAKLTSKP